MIYLFYIFGLFSLLVTSVSFIKNDYWLIRICDFPRLQVLILVIISIVAGILKFEDLTKTETILFFVFVSVAVFQGYKVAPYTRIWKKQVLNADPDRIENASISIFIANIYMENKEFGLCLSAIKENDPDLIFILEPNMQWQKELAILTDDYPFTKLYPLESTYGLLFYSKLELIDSELRFLLTKEIPSIKTKIKLKNGELIEFYGIHPKPPAPQEDETTTKRDAELIMVAKEIEQNNIASIVAGDLNDVAWSRTSSLFQKISKLLDPRVGRGLYPTFHAKFWTFRWPLDHVFHSSEFKLISLKKLKSVGSDHFPIFIKLAYIPAEKHHHEEPQADAEDKAEGDEKIAEAKSI